MFYKNWPYWLRGGIILVAIFVLFLSINLISAKILSNIKPIKVDLAENSASYREPQMSVFQRSTGYIFFSTFFLSIYPAATLPIYDNCWEYISRSYMSANPNSSPAPSGCSGFPGSPKVFFMQGLIYFIIGVAIGLIYGKIKTKK